MNFDKQNKSKEKVCSLWAGFGAIYRIHFEDETVILKHIRIPNDESTSSTRKTQSYYNELEFYSTIGSLECRIPKYRSHHVQPNEIHLVLEDLSVEFPDKFGDLNQQQLELSIDWLAQFHAFHWNTKKYAPKGGYWYLETRREELENIPKKYQFVREQAGLISQKCQDEKYQTIIHGDCKSENILWNNDASECAFVDFQYTGQGLGAQDLAYLICSSADPRCLKTDWFLEFYFEKLKVYLQKYNKDINVYTLELFTQHFDWCLLDFCRFLLGWGMWGNASWAIQRTIKLIS